MAHAMSPQEVRAFLEAGTRTGKLATVRANGGPHVAPVWFVMDGDDLVFMTGAETVKGKALRREGRAAISVDLETPPYAFVLVEGSVTLSTDLDEMLPLSIRIARRYMGEENAESFGARNAVSGELLVRLHLDRVLAYDDVSG
jgi:PPOX class probable F420-dependent enzyme